MHAREQMVRLSEQLDERETASVAAEILTEVDPTDDNLLTFFEDVGDEFKEQMYNFLHQHLGK